MKKTQQTALQIRAEGVFLDAVSAALDYALLDLGEIARNKIYDKCEQVMGMKRNQIFENPINLARFMDLLSSMFGASLSVIEKKAVEQLCTHFHLEPVKGWRLLDYVRSVGFGDVFQMMVSEIRRDPSILSSIDLFKLLAETMGVSRVSLEEVEVAKQELKLILNDYVETRVGVPLENNTIKFLVNELGFLLLRARSSVRPK
jgi:hypothetical protein